MFLTPEDESELLSKYKTNNHSDVLRSVSALPQTEAAKILRNSVVFGAPAADVAENPTAFDKGIAKQPNWFEVEHQYPKTAAFLYDPLNMAIVRTPENVRHLTTLETLIMPGFATKEGVKDLVRGNLAWWKGIRESQVYDKIGPQPEDMLLSGKGLAPLQKPDTSDIDKAIGKLAPDTSVQPDGKIAQYIYDVQRGTPQFVGQIAIGALTKSFSPAGRVLAQAGAMMPQIAGGDYLNLTGQGVEPERAFKAAMADAVTQSLLEGISFEAIIGGHLAKGVAKYLPKHAANLKAPVTVGLSALSEAFTETIQKYPEAMAEIWAKYANLSPREQAEKFVDDLWNITKEGLYEGAVAAPFGAVGGVVSVYANKFKEKKTQAEIDKIEKVQAAVTRSGLPGVSPELVANFVNSVNDETVFADPNALKLMQMEMPEVMERLNIEEEAIDEAIKSGQLIEISMGDYVAATTSQPEIHAQLKEHITVSEDGETLSRLRDIAAKPRNKQELSEARREVQAQQAELKSAQKEMYDEAVAAGMKADEAKNLVAIATANSRISSAGKGVNHAQWFRENRPMIRKGREMAAGAMGQFAGPFARTADKLQYEKAKSMLTEGRSVEEVRKATGWFKGMDGKMRFEIDDSKASFNPEIAKNKLSVIDAIKDFKVGFGREAKMGDILQHDMLYAAYPWIREIKVVAGDINDHGASYNTKTNTITIGRGLGFKPDNKVMGQFMHEIQHAIQTEEGFARGGSPDEFAKAYNKLKEMRPRIIKMLREAIDAKDMEKFRRILQEDKRVQRQLIALTGKDGLVGVDQYEQLAGEIEARDTAARANMGANERMESQPARSEDAIVVWNGHEIMFQEDYRGSHTAPTKKDGEQANPLHDISTVYPADIYGPMAGRYYGHGDKAIDDQSLRIIQQLRHNPNAKVTVYRAIPKGVDGDINAGDWVTINPQYAKMHGDHALNGKYKVVKKSVYARDIYTDGNSIHEWGYDPQPEVSKEEIAALKNRQRMYQSEQQITPEENIRRGKEAMQHVIDTQGDVLDAMYRPEVGGISFYWGTPGEGPKFKKGGGISHLIAKRNSEGADGPAVALKMAEVIAKGTTSDIYGPENGQRINIDFDGYTAVLSLYKDKIVRTWLLSGWEKTKEPSDATGEGDGSTGATLSDPMRTRPGEVADDSSTIIIPKPGTLFQSPDSAAFKAWFGDSKVVDEQGRPLVLYHQTSKENEQGIYKTGFDPKKIGARGSEVELPDGMFLKTTDKDIGVGAIRKEDIAQIALYASIQNPLIVNDRAGVYALLSKNAEYRDLVAAANMIDLETSKQFDELEKDYYKGTHEEQERTLEQQTKILDEGKVKFNAAAAKARAKAQQLLQEQGYDGVIVENDKGSFGRSTKTIIAFEPTQIKSVNNRGTWDGSNPNIFYQAATPTDAEAKLKQDETAFAQAVDALMDNSLDSSTLVNVMMTPLVMKLAGANVLPIKISYQILHKILKGKHSEDLSDFIVKQVPRAITDPLFVFKSGERQVVVLDLVDKKGSTIIVPLELKARAGHYDANIITSIYGKGENGVPNNRWIAAQITPEKLLYINNEKTLTWLQSAGLQLPMETTTNEGRSINTIPNENDLRKLQNQLPTYYQSAKGSIHWENGRAVISLFATADASTGIHELLGHYMTQNLLDLGAQADAPEWMQQDRRAMLEWAGVADWDSATKEEKVAAHEKWARAAEAYIMEGKAPSMELRGVFRRFADWLQQVYRSIKELGVEVSPEMRGVFDRMLATEEEINMAAEINNFAIENPEIYRGLSDKEKDQLTAQMDKILDRGKEILIQELMTDISAERKAAVEAERVKFEAQAREEIGNQPLYRMIRELRKPSVRNPVNELTKQWQKKVDDLAHYLRDNHGDGVENVIVFDGDQNDEQSKKEGFYRVTHNTKWYSDIYQETGKAPTLGRLKMLAEDFLRNGFDDVADRVPPDYEFVEIEKQLEELQKEPQALPIVRKINTAWLKENFPGEMNTFAFMHSNLGQYTLDDLAGFYGFSSADEIVYKVKNSPPFGQAVQNAVDAKIAESFPALFRDKEAVRAAAEAAIYNEESASLLAIQLGLIDEKRGKILNAEESRKQAMQDRELARQSAVKSIAKMSLDRAMRLTTWMAAERRAAENVEKAVSEKDWATAFEQKTIQLYNHAMVMESLRTRREFDRINKYFKRQKGSDVDGWISMEKSFDGTVAKNNSHFLQAAMLLKRMGFERKDGLKPEEPFAQYVKRMEAENPDICNIAEWLTFDSGTRSPRELTLTQLQDVEQALKNIKTMARAGMNSDGFYTLNGDGKMATVALLADTAEANVKDRQIDLPDKVNNDTLAARVADFVAGLRKPSKWMLELDGFKNFGIWAKTLYYSLSDADGFKSRLIATVNAKLEAAYERAGISKEQRYQDAHKKTYVPEWGTSVTRNYMREVLLHMGSESNMQRLFSRPPVGINGEWNRESVTAVLTKHLDAKEFRLAQDVWDAIDLYDEYTKMVKKVTGSELRKVNPAPIAFTLPTGETVHLRGGYYHLKADPRSSNVAELREEKELGSEPGRMPYPNTGASKERASSATYAVDLERSNIYSSVAAQAHDIAFRPVMLDINKLMRDERVKDTMRRKLGDASYKAFMKWLKVVGSGKNSTVEGSGWLDSMATAIRQRSIVANLLFRPGTVFQNAANPTLYGNSVDGFNNSDALAAYMKYGVADYIPKALSFSEEAEAIRQEVYALSVMMRDKMENPDYSLRDMHNRKGGFLLDHEATRKVGAKLAITHDNVLKFGSGLLAFTDQLTDIPMWRGAYYKAMADGKSQADAVRFADTVIESSTGSGRTIDSSLMQLGSPTEKLLSMFMSFINTQYNRWANEFGIYAKDHDHMRLLTFLGTQYLLFGTLSALASGKWKKDDEDLLEWYAKEVLEWPLSMIPVGGSMMKYVFDSKAGFQTFAWTASPAERNLGQLLKTAVSLGKNDAERSAEDAMQAASFLFGYPDQFNDWLWNAVDIANGRMEPRPEDLIRRRPRRER